MSQMFTGSICLTDLIEHAKHGHSAFTKAQNKKVYVHILTWLNDEPDKFGNIMSHQLNSTKDKRDLEGKVYIGNSKRLDLTVKADDVKADDFDNIPVRETNHTESIETIEPVDDLPF